MFFQFEGHQIRKFSNNKDFRKLDFLSEEKISELSLCKQRRNAELIQ